MEVSMLSNQYCIRKLDDSNADDIIPQRYLDALPDGHRANHYDTPGWYTMVCVEDGKYIGTGSFCRSRYEQYPGPG